MGQKMSKPDTWMPLYIGDYLRDTTRLSTEQHGAYLLLIMDYWTHGSLPDDDEALAQITRLQPSAWKKHRAAIARMFQVADGEWHHKRIDEELESARYFIAKQKANGSKGGRPKKNSNHNPDESQKKPMGFDRDNPNHNPDESPSPSPSQVNPPYTGSVVDHPPASAPQPPENATRKGALCKQLRSLGIDAAPHLQAWAELLPAYSDAEIIAAAEHAREKKPGERLHLNYLLPILRDRAAPPLSRNSKPEKFDPVAYVNRNRISTQRSGHAPDHETIDITPERVD